MIIVKSRGQLGNQMFQLAFALASSYKLKTIFFFHKVDLPASLHYFRLQTNSIWIAGKASLTFYRMMLPYYRWYNHLIKTIKSIIIQNDIEFNEWQPTYDQKDFITNNTYFRGYFQSNEFFKSVEGQVRQMFTIKKKYKQLFNKKYGSLNAKYAVVQIRRSDYLYSGNNSLGGQNLTLPDVYYTMGLMQLLNNSDIRKIFIISDDLDYCQKLFPSIQNIEFSVEQNSAIIDFQLMMHASALLISPSSFAWWAAYLNEDAQKEIYCPEFWLGHKVQKEFPFGIIPQGWHKLNYHNINA